MSQDFFQIIRARRSIRRFSDQPVPDDLLDRVVDSVRYCPSSMNEQPWQVIVVRDPEMKRRLDEFKTRWCPPRKSDYSVDWLRAAPVVLVVCVDEPRTHGRPVENGVIAGTYVMLAVTALGLGSTFLTAFNPEQPRQVEEAREILGLEASQFPVCILPVGYPGEEPAPKTLKDLHEVMRHDSRTA